MFRLIHTDASGRTSRGVRGLKSGGRIKGITVEMSHLSRGAWIEINNSGPEHQATSVAPLAGCVD